MIVLVVGSTGAGKTTYARKLAPDLPGVVYSIDNWMKSLFGADMPEDPQPEWFYENQQWYVQRIARCEKMITDLATQRAKVGQQSILDLGFSTEEHRKLFIDHFKDLDIPVSMTLQSDTSDLRRRIRESNRRGKPRETKVSNLSNPSSICSPWRRSWRGIWGRGQTFWKAFSMAASPTTFPKTRAAISKPLQRLAKLTRSISKAR